jgi:molybdopterin synthase sulfur carrier subunit
VMSVTVLVPGVLRGEAGGASRLTVQLVPTVPAGPVPPEAAAAKAAAEAEAAADTSTLGVVLDELRAHWPRLERRIRDERGELRRYVNVYVDGADCRLTGGLVTPVSRRCRGAGVAFYGRWVTRAHRIGRMSARGR